MLYFSFACGGKNLINMYLGKALVICVSGYDKQAVINEAERYCKENGYKIWNNVYRKFRLFKWKWEYKVDLYKPIDFEVRRLKQN